MESGKKGATTHSSMIKTDSVLSANTIIHRRGYGAAEEISDLYDEAARELGQDSADAYGCVSADQRDMCRMGKTQEMRRVFRQISLLSFSTILMSTWEFLLVANRQGLVDGGRAGLFWSYVWTLLGYGLLIASLAEMSSMAPTAGAQYHWVSEFAPAHAQRFLSYVTGWLATLCWQANNASGTFIAASMIQSMIAITHPNYVQRGWHVTLLVIPVMLVCTIFNVFFSRIGPALQNTMMLVHVSGFCAVAVILWVLAPHVDLKSALFTFENSGGWPTTGVAMLIGQITAVYSLGASDAAAHMSEEVRDASITVPRAMMGTYWMNGIMGLITLLTFVFCVPSVTDALNHSSGFPLLYVLELSVHPSAMLGVFVLILVLIMAGNISCSATTARQTFAFARDQGLPLFSLVGEVCPRKKVPTKAVLLTAVITLCLSLINIGSTSAFNTIISLVGIAQLSTYAISISCILHRRLTAPKMLPHARWSLGRLGVPINAAAVVYALFTWFWLLWPNTMPVRASNFNWAPVVLVGVMTCSLAYYFLKGRKIYEGPVMAIEGCRKTPPPRREVEEASPFDMDRYQLRFLSE